ncbi:MAG: 1-acyl-sn-glycerol-3-phosphate acyltransferase [Ignavibacteriales bacterium]|nr:1-acyl-sn-glycerol-3-phosphate acyltransferase [Ignavibacteriales bacterium]
MAILELLITPFHRTGKLFHTLAKCWAKIILKTCGVKVRVEGLENVDFSRSYIYVSNHTSQFDIPAVLAGIPDQIRIVYKKELEKIPFFGWGLKYGKTYISINRGKGQDAIQSLEEAANKIRTGASVLLFGEGTRSPDGKLQQFKRGPFNLAMKAGVPVIPVAINGSYRILPKHSLRIRPGTITLVLSSPIKLPSADGKESELALRDEVRAVIERNLQE